MKRGGRAAEKVRGEETTQGRCARVNDAMLSTRRLQPCLSEQQCRCVEHESQLAAAWRGPSFSCCFLQFTELLFAKGKEEMSEITEKEGGEM